MTFPLPIAPPEARAALPVRKLPAGDLPLDCLADGEVFLPGVQLLDQMDDQTYNIAEAKLHFRS